MHWILLFTAISSTVLAQGLLKAGAGAATLVAQMMDWRTIVGLGIYVFASLLYIVALRRIPLSVALPCTALSYVAAVMVGWLVFQEPLTVMRLGALALIASGVLVLATS